MVRAKEFMAEEQEIGPADLLSNLIELSDLSADDAVAQILKEHEDITKAELLEQFYAIYKATPDDHVEIRDEEFAFNNSNMDDLLLDEEYDEDDRVITEDDVDALLY